MKFGDYIRFGRIKNIHVGGGTNIRDTKNDIYKKKKKRGVKDNEFYLLWKQSTNCKYYYSSSVSMIKS